MRNLIFSLLIVSSLFLVINDANAIAYFPPPLKQISDGVLPENVTCTEGLEIIFKAANHLPACVKPNSVEKLIQRGWAIENSQHPPTSFADIVFENGVIHTVDKENLWAEAVAINNGKISFVGSNEEVQNYVGPNTEIINLDGNLMLPGIHDVHLHLLESASEAGGACLLDADDSIQGYIDVLNDCRPILESTDWIAGYGHDLRTIKEQDLLPIEILDQAIPDYPVVIMEWTSHSSWANSKALELAKIDKNTPNPPAGIIEKDPATGELTGILYENAGDIVLDIALASNPEIDQMNYEGLLWGIELLGENGITSIADARVYWDRNYDKIWQRAADEGELSARTVLGLWAYPHYQDQYQIEKLKSMYSNNANSLLKFSQVKFYADGLIESGTAKLVEPYSNQTGLHDGYGMNYFEQDRLAKYLVELEKVGFDAHIHAIGDGGVHEALNAIEKAREINGDLDARHRITHVELYHPDDLHRFKELGVIADIQVAGDFALPDGEVHTIEYVGEERIPYSFDIRGIYDSGAILTLSSDWSVSELSPFVGMQHALQKNEKSLPNLESVIETYTINGAYTMRQENITGSIEVGKLGDLIVVNQNIFEIPVEQIGDTKVLFTYLEGEQIFP